MLCKYIKGVTNLTQEQQTAINNKCIELYALELKVKQERLKLQSLLDNDVSMVHVGEIIELDKELLTIEPDAYIIKVRNTHSKHIEYITKAQLR